MNLIWNKNLSLFKNRFPALADLCESQISFFEKNSGTEQENLLYQFWNIQTAKNGALTVKENGLLLHSAYNPQREAEVLLSSKKEEIEDAKALVFESFGLFYAPLAAAALYPQKTIVLIEPDINRFLAAMLFIDAEKLFFHNSIIFALGAPSNQAITLLNQYGISDCVFFCSAAQTAHAAGYFAELSALIERNKEKEKINSATLEKFRKLWFSNSKRNIFKTALLEGVNIYENKAENLPFLVLGAGPSLEKILPFLKELENKVVSVCVDTALRACLRVKFQPDFIVLTDPQYWAYRHIAGLKSPKSILITENSVYPSVFNFECKKIVCCKSQIPVGHFFEKFCGAQGYLGAGGSVASCAWTFAKLCGTKKVFLCGMDLSFPNKQTHIKGSTFEQKLYTTSTKMNTAEKNGISMLFSGNVLWEKDFFGNPVLSDKRMKMFAWWFESNIASVSGLKTYTLSPEGLKIPGVVPAEIKELLRFPEVFHEKQNFLSLAESESEKQKKADGLKIAKREFNAELEKALNICRNALKTLNSQDDFQKVAQAERKYKSELGCLAVSDCLALVPPSNLKDFPKEDRTKIFFKSIAEFCASYLL